MTKKTTQTKLLKKKMSELTAQDLLDLEKPLGTSDRPFPMLGTERKVQADGRVDIEQVLSVIADDTYPMKVYSDRPYHEVVALAYCDMPVPSMLPIFFEGLERRKPESTNRTQMMIGDPGHGKSFLGALQGRLRSKESVEVFDCGGKNMNDLLFEMVLDFGTADALPKAIDKRLAAGVLEPISLALLGTLPCVTKDAEGNIQSIDWEAMKTAGTSEVSDAFETLKKVSTIEGLDNAGGNALGMNSQYGALIRAFLENREIVLDEYNKSREGSDNALQTVWQFLIGELKECTVENPLKNKDTTSGPSYFTFKREDTGLGFFVTLTGNRTEDGTTTRSLNKSVYSRLSPVTLPDPEIQDWQHRICQMMVGLPVSTLYSAFQSEADADPKAFGEWLMWLRKTKAEIEGTPVPELQENLLMNWKDVHDATYKLAQFYDTWATLTDSEKLMSTNNISLIDEVDEEYTKKEGIDFRKIKQNIEYAIPLRPAMLKEDAPRSLLMKAWDKAPKLGEKIEENPSLNFGTRLAQYLEDLVFQKTGAIGKVKLYSMLKKAMETFGLRDVTLHEGKRSDLKSIEQALNISAFSTPDLKKQAVMAQKVFCDYVRSLDPKITATNDEIIMPEQVLKALKQVETKETASTNTLFVPNKDLDTLSAQPLVETSIKDAAAFVMEEKKAFDFTAKDVVSHDELMASFAMPTIGRKNLSSIWEKNISRLTEDDADEGMKIAENQSEATGLGMTTVLVAHDNALVSVHIITNEQNKAVIISEKVPSKLLAAFKEAGITHIDRHSANAQAKVDTALSELLRGQTSASVTDRLVEAFKYRNDADAEHLAGKNPKLAALLVDSKIEMSYQKIVVKQPKKAA